MKKIYLIVIIATVIFGIDQIAIAQESTLASGLGLYVFPSNDQNKEQQDADELACYKWAKEQTGVAQGDDQHESTGYFFIPFEEECCGQNQDN